MRILDRQTGSDVLLATAFGVAVLCFVLVLGNVFKELFDLMINKNLPFGSVLFFVLLVLPFSLPFTIPWGFLTALLLVFGRMSADNELVAIRTNGVSLLRVCAPVFLLAIGLSGLCLWINTDVAPRAEEKMLSTVGDLASIDPMDLLAPDEVIDNFPDRRIYIGGKENGRLKNIIIFEMDDESMPTRMITAKEGRLTRDPKTSGLLFQFSHARFEHRDNADPANLENIQTGLIMEEGGYILPLDRLLAATRRYKPRRAYTLSDLSKYMAAGAGGEMLKAEVEYHRRFSLAMACVTFALMGVPLGVTAHRKETTAGFGISVAVALAYFFFVVLAQTFGDTPQAHPVFLMWLPNLLFGSLGIFLLMRLNRR